MDDECPHGLTPATCSICKHGPRPRQAPDVTTCRSCHAEIVWVTTEKGKRMPIDADPTSEGRFRLDETAKTVTFVKQPFFGEDDLYCSHFETCPDSKGWKRSR